MDEPDYIQAHKHCIFHRAEIVESDKCGCFYCLSIFQPNQIEEWVDEDTKETEQTALCPVCGADAVIGSASGYSTDKKFLEQMQQHWFGLIEPSFQPPTFYPLPENEFVSDTDKDTIQLDGVDTEATVISCWDTREGLSKEDDYEMSIHNWVYEYEYYTPENNKIRKHRGLIKFLASGYGLWFTKYPEGFTFSIRYSRKFPTKHIRLHKFD